MSCFRLFESKRKKEIRDWRFAIKPPAKPVHPSHFGKFHRPARLASFHFTIGSNRCKLQIHHRSYPMFQWFTRLLLPITAFHIREFEFGVPYGTLI